MEIPNTESFTLTLTKTGKGAASMSFQCKVAPEAGDLPEAWKTIRAQLLVEVAIWLPGFAVEVESEDVNLARSRRMIQASLPLVLLEKKD